MNTRDKLQKLFLSWVNDFVTVEKFAGYYGITTRDRAYRIINAGRTIHERRAEQRANKFVNSLNASLSEKEQT